MDPRESDEIDASRVARLTELLSVVFLISGAAALVFENLWFHQAGLTLGNSIWASSLVLAGFMGGLGLGNFLVGRYGRRIVRVVRAYAIIEVLISVAGVGLVFVLPHLTPLFAPIYRAFADVPWLLNALRFMAALALTLIPSTAMGATLPLLVSALHRLSPSFGSVLGRLYGMNTLGAVAGTLLAETVLVAAFGIRGAAFFAGGLNLLAALAAFTVLRDIDKLGAREASAPPERMNLSRRSWFLVFASFLSGGILLALEVVWFRFILLFAYGSSLGFALMLAVVLTGIGVGGLVAGRRLEQHVDHTWLPKLALLAGFVTAAAYAAMVPVTQALPAAFDWSEIVAYAVVLMFATSTLSGMLFTAVGAALDAERAEDAIGTASALTFANTVGAMIGPLLGGFVLLPFLGIETSIQLLSASYGLVALLLVFGLPASDRQRVTARFGAGLVALAIFAFAVPNGLMNERFLTLRIERYQSELVAMEEGLAATLLYLERREHGEVVDHRLATNSHSMSGTMHMSRRYMKLFVYLPVALHPDVEDALLISYGVGVTAKALTDTEEVDHIDVVDVSPETLELSRIIYPDKADHPLHDPRVEVHIEDGRYFLETTSRQYDLITGEPPPPKNAGIVNLYTREYFQLLYERLKEGGIASYWLPVHDLEESDSKAIIHAFCDVFEDCTLWHGSATDWILLGTRPETQRVSMERFEAQWRRVGDELVELGLERPGQLGALFLGDRRYLDEITADVPPLVDNYPKRIGFRLPEDVNAMYFSWLDAQRSKANFITSPTIERLLPPEARQASLDYFRWQDIISRSEFYMWEDLDERLQAARPVLQQTDLETLPLFVLGVDPDKVAAARAAHAKGKNDPEILRKLGIGALADRDFGQAKEYFEAAGEKELAAFAAELAMTGGGL